MPTQKLLDYLWNRNQPQVMERLMLLELAAHSPRLHDQALFTAHQLAGSLGMYGFPRGTDLARALELEFETSAPNPQRISTLAQDLRLTLFPNN